MPDMNRQLAHNEAGINLIVVRDPLDKYWHAAGNIISRFENKGFQLRGLKLFQTPKEVAEEHYKDLKEKPFYPDLVNYIVSGPVVCMVSVCDCLDPCLCVPCSDGTVQIVSLQVDKKRVHLQNQSRACYSLPTKVLSFSH